ncbi:MAG: FAD-dependent oxidoreductase [Candidatus Pacearchaeota archaeon]|nr:FAD-dependent oxidoreductase [Candidatus Pacearchaeota archaeon]
MVQVFNSRVLRISRMTSDVVAVRLYVPADFDFKAGQYLSLSVINSEGKKIRRPFSISNPPQKRNKFIEFCCKLVPGGLASEYIRKLKADDEVELFGPAGRFLVRDYTKDIALIASGVGIAPFMSMIPDVLSHNSKSKVILIKSSRAEKDILYEKELERLEKEHPNFRFYNVFSMPKNRNSNKGYVQDFLRYIPHDFNGDFYVCGLKEMIISVKEKLVSMGFKEEQIFYEKFD